MRQPSALANAERGQSLVLFVLVITVLLGMSGLVVDGGGTFVQRRNMQNAADLAAMAGGYGYLNGADPATAAQQVATTHGFTDGQNSTTVSVVEAWELGGTTVTVSISRPHQNYFASILGMSSWPVSTTAKVLAGVPNEAAGAMPIIFNQDVCPLNGSGVHVCPGQDQARSYDEPPPGPVSIPAGSFEFNWTVFCLANGNPCNANTHLVDGLINGTSPTSPTLIDLGMDIDPLNAGSHTSLFSDLAAFVGQEFPVAIVNDAGELQGFAVFKLLGSVGGSTKQITGYFVSGITTQSLLIGPGAGTPHFYGLYSIRLVN